MKRVLLVTTRFPFSMHSGFASKNFNLIKALSKNYIVDLIVIDHSRPTADDRMEVQQFLNSISFFKPSTFDVIIGILSSLLTRRPLHFGIFYSREAFSKVYQLSNECDIAIGSVCRSWPYIRKLKMPLFMDLADSLTLVYRENAKITKNIPMAIFYSLESFFLYSVEKEIVEKCNDTFVFNPNEANWLKKFKGSITQVSHGVPESVFLKIKAEHSFGSDLIIFGKMDFHPNEDAVFWFTHNVLPYLPRSIRLIVVGASPSKAILELSRKESRVIVKGFIENPYPILAGALASIAPIRLGGGIQNKVLESLACGARVIISSKAASSLPDIDSSGALVCNSPNEWVETIIKCYNESKNMTSKSTLGPSYILNNFTWDKYSSAILDSISLNIKSESQTTYDQSESTS